MPPYYLILRLILSLPRGACLVYNCTQGMTGEKAHELDKAFH